LRGDGASSNVPIGGVSSNVPVGGAHATEAIPFTFFFKPDVTPSDLYFKKFANRMDLYLKKNCKPDGQWVDIIRFVILFCKPDDPYPVYKQIEMMSTTDYPVCQIILKCKSDGVTSLSSFQ